MKKNNYNYRLYGRRSGRKKNKIKKDNYNKLIDKYKTNKLNPSIDYILDIGSGYGETTLFLGKRYINKKIISCDKYIDGNFSLLKKIDQEKISNINIFDGNVYELLESNIKKQYFNEIWIFFPDPWPKKKHFKRRLITSEFLQKLYDYTKEHAKIYIATDSISYSKFIVNSIYQSRQLYECTNIGKLYLSIKDYYNLETKYYKKAIISGRMPGLFILERI